MVDKAHTLGKGRVLDLLEEAKELVPLYDRENNRNPRHSYDYRAIDGSEGGSVDESETIDLIALRLLERRGHFVTTGIKLNGDKVKIFGRTSYPGSDSFIVLDEETVEYAIPGFEHGTTISRFVKTICEVVSKRADSNSPELQQAMMPNAKAYARRTKQEIEPYLPNGVN